MSWRPCAACFASRHGALPSGGRGGCAPTVGARLSCVARCGPPRARAVTRNASRVRRARTKRRPIVVLCDVSGSMDRYSRHLLVFAHAIGRRERVETFAFSTHLTRITHLLRHGDIDAALDHVASQVHDIGGGTRIADALHAFQRDHARRVLGHGAVVLIISDGWDRGDPDQLGREMARLRRSCYRLIWLNPLLGSSAYQPETRGMAAALPHCDDFLSAHNVDGARRAWEAARAAAASRQSVDARRRRRARRKRRSKQKAEQARKSDRDRLRAHLQAAETFLGNGLAQRDCVERRRLRCLGWRRRYRWGCAADPFGGRDSICRRRTSIAGRRRGWRRCLERRLDAFGRLSDEVA